MSANQKRQDAKRSRRRESEIENNPAILILFATWGLGALAFWRLLSVLEGSDSGVILQLMESELTLRIILEKPTPGVDFGLQKGRGSDYETVQTQRSKGKNLQFEFSVRAKQAGKNAMPNFLGPFVQGPAGERFVYIDIGTYAGQTETCWSRRLKIPLRGLTASMIEAAISDRKLIFETRVPGSGKDGSPSCATVKPFPGWNLVPSKLKEGKVFKSAK